MGTVGQAIAIIGGICGIIVFVAGALVIARSSFSKAQIEALREDNTDLRNRVKDLEDKETRNTAEISRLSGENELLKGMVTQRAQVEQVLAELNVHHEAAMEVWDKMEHSLEDLNSGMSAVSRELGRLGRSP